jgi:hypothetical protein
MSSPTGPESVTLDEMEQGSRVAPKMDDIKLDGEGIPEHLKGKSAADLVKMLEGTQEAVRISERAREQAELTARALAKQEAPPPPPMPEPEPELSEEQVAELYQNDPVKAIKVLSEQAVKRAEKNLENRLGPMMRGSASAVESAARTKYAEEFELFGEEITRLAGSVPNKEAILSNPAAWDDMISLIRGRPGNFEKLIERKSAGKVAATRTAAQAEQADTIGFTDSGAGRGRKTLTQDNLDSTQKEIADKMGLTPKEYAYWANVGTRLD